MDRQTVPDPLQLVGEDEPPVVLGRGGPPFWEEWRGTVPDEEIEFVRFIFEEFCGSWE